MSRPVTWTTVPIAGDYAAIFTDLTAAAMLFETDQVVTCDGVTVFGGRLQVPLDGAGKLATELPATDDPSLNVQGWVYRVRELWLGGRTFYMSVPIAAAGTGINMADVAPVADPTTGELYVKGDSAYQVAVDNGFVGTESQWLASLTGEVNLSDTTPLALGVAAAGTSVDASRSDHVHPMPSATDVGADPAGTAATAVAAITPTGIGAIATSEKGVANGVATLDAGGLVPTAQLPPLAISDTFVVNAQAAMLALTAQPGDVCVRTDSNATYILATSPASTLANWVAFLAPGQVVSVNSKAGVVSLTAADVGLGNVDNTSDADKPVSAAQATALNTKFDKILAVSTTLTTFTLHQVTADDFDHMILCDTGATYGQIQVPPDATMPAPIGTRLFCQYKSGSVFNVAPGTGVTFLPANSTVPLGASATSALLTKIAPNTWNVDRDTPVILAADPTHAPSPATAGQYAVAVFGAAAGTYAATLGGTASGSGSTAIGRGAQATATNSTAIGQNARATLANSTAIGSGAITQAANEVRLGAPGTFVAAWGPIIPGSYTVAALPLSPGEGATAYATNGLKVGEATGSGTGVPVYYSAGKWRVYSTDAQVQS